MLGSLAKESTQQFVVHGWLPYPPHRFVKVEESSGVVAAGDVPRIPLDILPCAPRTEQENAGGVPFRHSQQLGDQALACTEWKHGQEHK